MRTLFSSVRVHLTTVVVALGALLASCGGGGGGVGSSSAATQYTSVAMAGELLTYTVVCMVFVIFMVIIVTSLDYGFTKLVFEVFG